jgi:protein-S-isoprenylcysteine O-methyltransferase Ste14
MKTSALANPMPKPILFKARTRYFRWAILGLLPFVALTEPHWDEHSFIGEALPLAGLLLIVVGVITRIFSTLYVGGRKNDVLMVDGPFSVVRNPLYVGSLIATLGVGFMTGSLLIAAAITGLFLALHHHTIAREEAFLREKFGQDYVMYYAVTPRWIPRLSLWKSPGDISVKPVFILRTIRDGMMFVLAIPLLMLIAELRDHGTIPTLFFAY